MAGLPKAYIKKWGVSKRAWKEYRAKSLSGTKKSSKKSVRKTAKKKGRRRYSMTIPLAPMVGLAAGLASPIDRAIKGNIPGAVNDLKYNYLGLTADNRFDFNGLMKGLVPLVAGLLVHKYVGGPPLNFNAMLGRARVPFLRI